MVLTSPLPDLTNVNVIYIHTRLTMPITAKLDELGKPAWIALMVLGFMVWWPIGLVVLAFTIGSGRMGCGYRGGQDRWQHKMERMQQKMDWMRSRMGGAPTGGFWG